MSALRWALHRWRKLSARERLLLAEAAGLLPIVHLAQQRLEFARWRALFEKGPPSQAPGPRAPSVEQIAWAVSVARRWVPGEYKCLPAAYATHLLLHRYGYDSQVHVGVARDAQGKVEAHAWVDCGGRTVMGLVDDMARFVPFPPLRTVPR